MIPSFEKFLYPVLFLLKDGSPLQRDKLRSLCVEYMGFTDDELQERISSGKKFKIVDRLQWATYYLLKAGLLSRPTKATDQITEKGIMVLNTGITDIDRQYLRANFEEYRLFEQQARNSAKEKLKEKHKIAKVKKTEKLKSFLERDQVMTGTTLEHIQTEALVSTLKNKSNFELKTDKIATIVENLNNDLIKELTGIINDFDSESFVVLLRELLPIMGYSSSYESVNCQIKLTNKVTTAGMINIDELGLSKFLLVAHNGLKEEVGAIDVQSFMGYLSTCGLSQGVYITTSRFSEEALNVPSYGSVKVILIDGTALAKLMIKFNLGVVTRKVFEIKDVNQEYLFTHLAQ